MRWFLAGIVTLVALPAIAAGILFASLTFADCPGLHGSELDACEHIQWAAGGAALAVGLGLYVAAVRLVLKTKR
jgi:F0F1-type ATP synthase membrane subunit c/vacuolar-type H+-ATPase subunit K